MTAEVRLLIRQQRDRTRRAYLAAPHAEFCSCGTLFDSKGSRTIYRSARTLRDPQCRDCRTSGRRKP